ncbi:MAG TPA: hypothetical protein ENH97_00885 [bacterium]|nr:hypothetical protein [bacterium]
MNSLKRWIPVIIFILAIFLSSNNVYAIRQHVPLYKQVDKSDLIIIGTVFEVDIVYEKKYVKTPEGKVLPRIAGEIPSSELNYVFTAKVEKVIKGEKGIKEVTILAIEEKGGLDAFYGREEHGLFFLKRIDAARIKERKLSPGVYYTTVAKAGDSNFPSPFPKPPGYIKTVKKVVKIESIKDDRKRTKAWIKAVRSDDKVLKDNAIRKLWDMRATEAIPTLKTVSKDDELYSLAQAAIGVIEMFPKKPIEPTKPTIEPTKPINRMIILMILGIVVITSIVCYLIIKRKKKAPTT